MALTESDPTEEGEIMEVSFTPPGMCVHSFISEDCGEYQSTLSFMSEENSGLYLKILSSIIRLIMNSGSLISRMDSI